MSNKVKIAIDAMSGDNAPKKIIDGIEISLKSNKDNFFYLFGQKSILEKEIEKRKPLYDSCEIIDTKDIIQDEESPLTATKKGKDSSMWKAIESLKEKKSDISLSAGNTGALLIMSRLLLNAIDGINKPALAALWPSSKDMSIVLDLGANIECPKIALLNIGSEEHKGNDVLKKTFSILKEKNQKNYEFCGYIEPNHIMEGKVDVIITDGFTGNIALKTAEGTANFITKNLKNSLNKFSMLLSYRSLKKFKNKLDPRKYNGAIFLGLENPVVKSHGSTDAIGFAHSIDVCHKIVKGNLIEKIKSNLINVD